MTLARVRDVALTITAVAGAAAVLFALADRAGPMATLAIASALGMLGVVIAGQRAYRWGRALSRTVEDVRYHLAPNGNEGMLPEHMRGRPMRDLVSNCVERLERGDQKFEDIDGRLGALEERRTA